MSKNEDKIEEIRAELAEIKTQNAIKEEVGKRIRIVCVTATGSFLSFMYWLGGIAYQNSEAIKAAIKAYWEMRKM